MKRKHMPLYYGKNFQLFKCVEYAAIMFLCALSIRYSLTHIVVGIVFFYCVFRAVEHYSRWSKLARQWDRDDQKKRGEFDGA